MTIIFTEHCVFHLNWLDLSRGSGILLPNSSIFKEVKSLRGSALCPFRVPLLFWNAHFYIFGWTFLAVPRKEREKLAKSLSNKFDSQLSAFTSYSPNESYRASFSSGAVCYNLSESGFRVFTELRFSHGFIVWIWDLRICIFCYFWTSC